MDSLHTHGFIILEETTLNIQCTETGERLFFASHDSANEYASRHCNIWSIIEVDFIHSFTQHLITPQSILDQS